MELEKRKFIENWGLAILFSVLTWILTFLEAGITYGIIKNSVIWTHNYMVFSVFITFMFAFIYMKRVKELKWLEESLAYGIVFILINLFLDYSIIFLILNTYIFNFQNLFLYILQFLSCILAAFVVKKKYSPF